MAKKRSKLNQQRLDRLLNKPKPSYEMGMLYGFKIFVTPKVGDKYSYNIDYAKNYTNSS